MGIFSRNKEDEKPTVNAADALTTVIGAEQIKAAEQIRQNYQAGKKNLESRIINCENWYKLRNWEMFEKKSDNSNDQNDVKTKSAWLFNAIANKHADALDNIPSASILPREENDKEEAQRLSSIIPVIQDQANFEKVYSECWYDKLISGTAVYGVFWNDTLLNGLGEIEIKEVDVLSLFWEPGIEDIQDSQNLFFTHLVDNKVLEELYPQCKDMLTGTTDEGTHYEYDDTVSTDGKSTVVDWYYKKNINGKTVLHYCKYVNDIVLYATENERQKPKQQVYKEDGTPLYTENWQSVEAETGESIAETGLYAHGKYPFVFDPLFRIKGTPCGFGYVDVGKSPQELIDRMDSLLLKNMYVNARPRFFIKKDGAVKEEEFADLNKDFIHVDGNLGQDSIIPVTTRNLPGIYVTLLNNKIEELKETTGNRDSSNGGTTGGITSASGLAAQIEQGSKLSRDANKQTYRAYREVILLVIELIRQFYSVERSFRIIGENGQAKFIDYTNKDLRPQPQGEDGTTEELGIDVGYRVPLFDIEVAAQKQSPYTKMAQNDLAIQLYSMGFFNPDRSDPALACLDMMDFDRKSFVEQRIRQNGTMADKLQQLMAITQQLSAEVSALRGAPVEPMNPTQGEGEAAETSQRPTGNLPKRSSEAITGGESGITARAKARVAEMTAPR